MFGHGKHKKNEALATSQGTEAIAANSPTRGESKGYVLIAIIYLLGLCMGALDMGIVNPARTVIQNSMGIEDSLGVWILTIYTLAYAASIPIMGKLADRHGRKYIYLTCIFLFGAGSALCGISQSTNSFEMLLAGRVIQALGGGGIMPVATAEFGTAFPEEKRGMALGIVGMVYGLASILGSTFGSLILDIFGQTQWQFIFWVNIPVCLAVVLLGIGKLPNSSEDNVKPIDALGILLLTAMTLSVMYGLKNIDFFEFFDSIQSMDVWPFLLAFVLLLPLFVLRERHAADPIINIKYFANINIVITLICAVISGIIMMGTLFYPQFSENSMLMKSGSGGYFIALLGLGSAFGAMSSGKLIDKHGIKPVLAAGFIGSAIGSLFMAFVACEWPNVFTVCFTMFLTGTGLGFTMGTPLNYMMLQNTDEAESNSALATMTLVRSIGTAVAPAIMVAFIMHAGLSMQDNLMNAMPNEVTVSALPHAAELDKKMDDLRNDPDTKDMLEGIDIPRLSDYQTFEVNMNKTDSDFDVEISDAMKDELQSSDVTNIVGTCKDMAREIFSQVKPTLVQEATDGIQKGIDAMKDKSKEMKDGLKEMDGGISEMDNGLSKLTSSIGKMDGKIGDMDKKIKSMEKGISEMSKGVKEMKTAISSMNSSIDYMNKQLANIITDFGEDSEEAQKMKQQIAQLETKKADLEQSVSKMEKQLEGMKSARDGMKKGKAGMTQGKNQMATAKNEMLSGRTELTNARGELQEAYDSMLETIQQLKDVKKAIPGLFDEAETNYIAAIDETGPQIQSAYQSTLNSGFKGMALFVVACSVIGLLVLIPYKDKGPANKGEAEGASESEARRQEEPAAA